MVDMPVPPPPRPSGETELIPADANEVVSSIRLGLSLDSDGRPRGRAGGDPRFRESKLWHLAERIYEQLKLSNFRIFRGPSAKPHGGTFPGPPRQT